MRDVKDTETSNLPNVGFSQKPSRPAAVNIEFGTFQNSQHTFKIIFPKTHALRLSRVQQVLGTSVAPIDMPVSPSSHRTTILIDESLMSYSHIRVEASTNDANAVPLEKIKEAYPEARFANIAESNQYILDLCEEKHGFHSQVKFLTKRLRDQAIAPVFNNNLLTYLLNGLSDNTISVSQLKSLVHLDPALLLLLQRKSKNYEERLKLRRNNANDIIASIGLKQLRKILRNLILEAAQKNAHKPFDAYQKRRSLSGRYVGMVANAIAENTAYVESSIRGENLQLTAALSNVATSFYPSLLPDNLDDIIGMQKVNNHLPAHMAAFCATGIPEIAITAAVTEVWGENKSIADLLSSSMKMSGESPPTCLNSATIELARQTLSRADCISFKHINSRLDERLLEALGLATIDPNTIVMAEHQSIKALRESLPFLG